MASATQFPADINVFQMETPSYPNPRLAAPISATATTITVTAPPLDKDGNVITGKFLAGIENAAGYVETIWVPAAAVSVDGLTWTGVVRGVRLAGIDYTTAGSGLAVAFEQDSPVFCNISAVLFQLMFSALNGTIASGGTTWRIGDETDQDIYVYAQNADANKPYFKYDKATNAWIYSNDGTSSTPFGTGAGVTGGDGITVTAGDIDIDLTDTVIFKQTSAGAGDSGKVTRVTADGRLDSTFNPLIGIVYAADAGASDTYAITLSPAATAYVTGMSIIFKANTVNTGPATLNVNGLGAKTIKKNYNSDLADGDIKANQFVEVVYDGTNFQMLSPNTPPTPYAFKNGTDTKVATDASTTQNIAHGLGYIPKKVKITAVANYSAAAVVRAETVYNGTTQSSVSHYTGGGGTIVVATTFTLNATVAGGTQSGVVTFDATNIIITWTKTGSPDGTYTLLWEAEG